MGRGNTCLPISFFVKSVSTIHVTNYFINISFVLWCLLFYESVPVSLGIVVRLWRQVICGFLCTSYSFETFFRVLSFPVNYYKINWEGHDLRAKVFIVLPLRSKTWPSWFPSCPSGLLRDLGLILNLITTQGFWSFICFLFLGQFCVLDGAPTFRLVRRKILWWSILAPWTIEWMSCGSHPSHVFFST